MLSINQISSLPIQDLKLIKGGSAPADSLLAAVATPSVKKSDCLYFVSTQKHWEQCRANAKAVIILASILPEIKTEQSSAWLFSVKSISQAMTQLLKPFDRKNSRFTSGVHPTAVIGTGCQIGADAHIGPYAVIGSNCHIGTQARIGSHVVIESDCQIADSVTIHPHAFIGQGSQIGHRVEIHSFVSLGSDGFGFHNSSTGEHVKIPQVGIVVIEDDVEIGAQTTIDRATLHETRIKSGTKFDKHCHVAHNCEIGKNGAFAANFTIAGSSKMGESCMTAGDVSIANNVSVCDRVIFGGRAATATDVTEPGAYTGYPLQPMKAGLKTLSTFAHLPEMRRTLAKVLKHLKMDETP